MRLVVSGNIYIIKFTPVAITEGLSTSVTTTPPSGGVQVTDSLPSTSVTSSIS